MTTFQELGSYLDKVYKGDKLDAMKKIVEDLIFPKIEVKESQSTLEFKQCAPRVFYKCVQVYKANGKEVAQWLRDHHRFDEVELTERGIITEYGTIFWTDWIVLEPNEAVVFVDDKEFDKEYILNE